MREPVPIPVDPAPAPEPPKPKKPKGRARPLPPSLERRIRLDGFDAVKLQTNAAKNALRFRDELTSALGGADEITPQRAKLVELAARSSMLLDHVDHWIFSSEPMVTPQVMSVVAQRQGIANHLMKVIQSLGLDRRAKVIDEGIELEQLLARTAHRGGA